MSSNTNGSRKSSSSTPGARSGTSSTDVKKGAAQGQAAQAQAQTGSVSGSGSSSEKAAAAKATTTSTGDNGARNRLPMQISSDEINVLIYRYLQESGMFMFLTYSSHVLFYAHVSPTHLLPGFVHSAFTFAYESMIGRSNVSKANVPPGALISFLQKGLQYVGIEETLRQDGTDRKSHMNVNVNGNGAQDIDFTLLSPHSIKALTRKNPPIKLNVPPATAAAAIKARLESDAKAQVTLNHNHAHTRHTNTNGTSNIIVNRNGSLTTPQAVAQQIQASTVNVNHTNQIAQVMMRQNQVGNNGTSAAPTSVFGNGYIDTTSIGAGVGVGINANDQSKAAAAAALVSVGAQGAVATAMEIDGGGGAQHSHAGQSRTLPTSVVSGAGAMHTAPEAEAVAALLAGAGKSLRAPPQQQAGFEIESENVGIASIPQLDPEIEREDILSRASPDEVLELNKHTSEVFMCAWNPIFTDLLATGSGDASARIWKMGGKNAKGGSDICRLLPHGTNSTDKKNKDVTTLEWSSNGELLATGSYDGVARVWGRTGAIVHTLTRHIGPIFSLKWNKSGKFLLSGSYDKTTIVWDVSGDVGIVKQQFSHHTAPALDVDWKDDATFASCSTDKTVAICKVGTSAPLHEFRGHNDEVNAVKWDPSGTLLASCSDDSTAKVWDASSGSSEPLHDFTKHKQEIYTVKWYVFRYHDLFQIMLFPFLSSLLK